jgi:putative transposase
MRWLAERGPGPRYLDPGCPWQNPCRESFDGRPRDECLDRELVANRREAVFALEARRREYDEDRPHSRLGDRTPRESQAAWMRGSIPRPEATEGIPTHRPQRYN